MSFLIIKKIVLSTKVIVIKKRVVRINIYINNNVVVVVGAVYNVDKPLTA
jgi:hypothetical protein